MLHILIFASAYNVKDYEFIKDLKLKFLPTHYEIGIELAKLLGFSVENPNFKEGIFYINDTD